MVPSGSAKSLNKSHEIVVQVLDVCVLLLLVKPSGANTFAGRDSPLEVPNWEGRGQVFKSLQ